jgi:hypothetical protein
MSLDPRLVAGDRQAFPLLVRAPHCRAEKTSISYRKTLKEAIPLARRIGVLWNPSTPSHAVAVKAVETGGEKLGVELRMVAVSTRRLVRVGPRRRYLFKSGQREAFSAVR